MVNRYFIYFFTIITTIFSYLAYQPYDVIIGGPVITDQNYFEYELELISNESDLKIKYVSMPDIETYILENPNHEIDIALIPNPQSVITLGDSGLLIPIEELISSATIENSFSNHLKKTTTSKNTNINYGVFFRLFPNSLIWYDVEKYNNIGAPVFGSFNEIIEFTELNSSQNNEIWCLDIESGASTGWIATNWLEDLLIHNFDLEVYDHWSNLELLPSSYEIVSIFDDIGKLVFPKGYVLGSNERVVRKEFRNNFVNLTDENFSCIFSWSGHYSSYYFPKDLNFQDDYDFMKFPTLNNNDAIVGIGDILVATNAKKSTEIVINILINDTFGEKWMSNTDATYIPANLNNKNQINNPLTLKEKNIVQQALLSDSFRYDASELMERRIGSDALWIALKKYLDLGPTITNNEFNQIIDELESKY